MQTTSKLYRVERKDICFLRYTLEGYDGLAIVTTLNKEEGIVSVSVTPECEAELEEIMKGLEKEMHIEAVLDQTPYRALIPWGVPIA